ncbi:PHP domain-containing protein [Chloroflexota bacterium]
MNLNDITFKKADLHLHTPRSLCYSEQSSTPEQIVDAALACGLEVIAITDHNTAEALDGIRQYAGKKGLFVFPGAEISTKGGHVLAIFELDTPVERLDGFLDYVGITHEGRGDAATLAEDSTEVVFQKIEEQGGIAIAAHIERWPSGFLQSSEPRSAKISIHDSKYLTALEITVPESKSLWNNGLVHGYLKKYACVQSSDAHGPGEIGRRQVYIQMGKVGLVALRSAFAEYKTKILFPNELPENK